MGLEQVFSAPCEALRKLKEEVEALRVMVVEDKPLKDELMLVDELGNTVEDLCGWVNESFEFAMLACQAVAPRFTPERAYRTLSNCHERFQQVLGRFALELMMYERLDDLLRLGRERSGEWQAWTDGVRGALDTCQPQLLEINQLLFRCWQELAERIDLGAMQVQANNIGTHLVVSGKYIK